MSGSLVLVATPIGNLGDLSPRARQALEEADIVACEDTRRTGRLLQLCGLTAKRLVVVNEHTERAAAARLIEDMAAGATVALVSDAGTPIVADPGERLVRAAVEAGLVVTIVPGPSAVVAALAVSGLPSGRFVFEGFLPRRGGDRSQRIGELAAEARTIVLYESPHRVAATLSDLAAAFGSDRSVAVCRELTKLHEQTWRGRLADAAVWAGEAPIRGEVALVLAGAPASEPPTDDELRQAVVDQLARGVSTRDAVAAVAERVGVNRRRVYDLAIDAQTVRQALKERPRTVDTFGEEATHREHDPRKDSQ